MAARVTVYQQCVYELQRRGYNLTNVGSWVNKENSYHLLNLGWNSTVGDVATVEFEESHHYFLNLGIIVIRDVESFIAFMNIIERLTICARPQTTR